MDYRYSLAGLIVGTFVGLSGVGGSAILAPVLILLLHVKPSVAIGTDLLYSVPTKLFAMTLHARQKTVDWKLTRQLLYGGIPGGLGGLYLYTVLRRYIAPETLQLLLRHAIGIAILAACVGASVLWFARRHASAGPTRPEAPLPALSIAGIGLLVGLLVSITSIGSGSITLPLLVLALPAATLRRLIGSEIAFAAFLVPLAAAGHVAFGDVNWPMTAALVAGALPGVWIGSQLCRVLDEGWMRPIVLGVLAFAASRLV